MNKKLTSNIIKALFPIIALKGSPINLDATASKNTKPSFNFFSSIKGTVQDDKEIEKKKNFARDLLGIKNLPEGAYIQTGKKIGKGRYGSVKAASCEGRNLIIKEGIDRGYGKEAMEMEFQNSNAFMESIAQQLNQKEPEYIKLIGAGSVITVLGKTQDGSLIQDQVNGDTLSDIILNKNPPYNNLYDGFYHGKPTSIYCPENLQEAVGRAASFYAALTAIHEAGFVHCDLHNQNVMLLNDPESGYPCRIIDLGIMQKRGKAFPIFLQRKNQPQFIQLVPPEYRGNRYYRIIEPAYDIFCSARILLSILFGWSGQAIGFDGSTGNLLPINSVNIDQLDEYMRNFDGPVYPKPILERIKTLLKKIVDNNPNKRPTATQIFEELQDMALADWTNSHYAIAQDLNLSESIINGIAPYGQGEGHFPNNPISAIALAATFYGALQDMHNKKFVYCGLHQRKLKNIIIEKTKNNPPMQYFCYITQDDSTQCAIHNQHMTFADDILYSAQILLYILFGFEAYQSSFDDNGNPISLDYRQIDTIVDEYNNSMQANGPGYPKLALEYIKYLLKWMLDNDPNGRPSASQMSAELWNTVKNWTHIAIPRFDLIEAITKGIAPYNKGESHFPNDLATAIGFAANFYGILQNIHGQGFVHYGMHVDELQNIMFVDNPAVQYSHCEILFSNAIQKSSLDMTPADDILFSTKILLYILFGFKGYQRCSWIFTPNFYMISQAFDDCNKSMNEEMQQAYPEFVLDQIKELLKKMLDDDPDKRPSAMKISETLGEIQNYMKTM